MLNYLTFNNNQSTSYGVYISGSGVYNAPARAYEMVSVPGKNGDLIISNNKYENIEVVYPAFCAGSNFKQNLADFRSMLLSVPGYAKLTDTYHTDEFRAAYFADGLTVEALNTNNGGEFEVLFNCKPQRFLTSGETAVDIASGGTITNPTLFAAKPSIFVRGYGTLTVGNDTITIANTYPSIIIDSEIMDCYASGSAPIVNSAIVGAAILGSSGYTANANASVTFSTGDFPLLQPGTTTITYTNTITAVTIIPRWWRL